MPSSACIRDLIVTGVQTCALPIWYLLHLPQELAYWLGGAVTLFIFVLFLVWRNKYLRRNPTI